MAVVVMMGLDESNRDITCLLGKASLLFFEIHPAIHQQGGVAISW
jgi:hypothetical protein